MNTLLVLFFVALILILLCITKRYCSTRERYTSSDVKKLPDKTLKSGESYGIYSQSDLEKLATLISNSSNNGGSGCSFYIANDISVNSLPKIGSSSYPFQGEFDGQNYTITLTANSSGLLFQNIQNATVSNITLSASETSIYIDTSYGWGAGGMVGVASEDSLISNCTNNVDINTKTLCMSAGGIVGVLSDSTVYKCVNNGDISGNVLVAGGVVGSGKDSTINTCSNNGNIDGMTTTGDIIGSTNNVEIISDEDGDGDEDSDYKALPDSLKSGESYGIYSQSDLEKLATLISNSSNNGGSGCSFYIANDISVDS